MGCGQAVGVESSGPWEGQEAEGSWRAGRPAHLQRGERRLAISRQEAAVVPALSCHGRVTIGRSRGYSPCSEGVTMVSRLVGGVLSQGRRTGPVGDHPSLQPTWPIGRAARGTLGLAPSGGCRAAGVATDAGALLPHRFTLTCARRRRSGAEPSAVFSLLPFADRSPRPGSRQRSALWSPDLPRPTPDTPKHGGASRGHRSDSPSCSRRHDGPACHGPARTQRP